MNAGHPFNGADAHPFGQARDDVYLLIAGEDVHRSTIAVFATVIANMTTNGCLVNRENSRYANLYSDMLSKDTPMAGIKNEREWAERAARHLKAELKRAEVTYEDLAERMKKHGFKSESKASIASKLSRATMPAAFFLAALVAIGAETVKLEDI